LRRAYRFIIPSFVRKILFELKSNYVAEIDSMDLNADFQEIYDRFFVTAERPPVYTKCISSRHFEAVGTCTLQIMYPGRFNDILKPNEHYFELRKDRSNIEDLFRILSDSRKIIDITSAAHEHVVGNHTYEHRLDELLNFL